METSETLQTTQIRTMLVLLAAAAFVVVLGGLAWACLPYHGVVSVYPVNPGGQAVNQFAHGERAVTIHGGAREFEGAGGMRWCTESDDADANAPYQAGAIRPSMHSPDLMVVVEDRLSACHEEGQGELPVGPYNVAINHAVYGDDGMNGFDKNAVSEDDGHRLGSCYFQTGDNPADYDYVHPEPLMVHEDGGSLLIENTHLGPSSEARPFDNIAGLCLRSDDHARAPIVPIEILGDRPGNPGGNGNGRR